VKRGDSVGLPVDVGLIAVGMIGDISLHAGLFSDLEEAVERFLVCEHAGIHPSNLTSRSELAGDGASTPEGKQMAASVIGDGHQHRYRAWCVARGYVHSERRITERELLSIGDVHSASGYTAELLAGVRRRQLRHHVPVHG